MKMLMTRDDGYDSIKFEPDFKGLAQCYDTTAGAGVGGGGMADVGQRVKGLPMWTYVIPLIIAGICLNYFSDWVAHKAVGSKEGQFWLKGPTNSAPVNMGKGGNTAALGTKQSASGGAQVAPGTEGQLLSSHDRRQDEPELFVTGIVIFQGRAKVYLSDGRLISNDDPKLQALSESSVLYDGKILGFDRRPSVHRVGAFNNGQAITPGLLRERYQ